MKKEKYKVFGMSETVGGIFNDYMKYRDEDSFRKVAEYLLGNDKEKTRFEDDKFKLERVWKDNDWIYKIEKK